MLLVLCAIYSVAIRVIYVVLILHIAYKSEMVVGWVHPWVGLGWVGLGPKFSWLKWIGLASVTRIYILFAIIKLTLHCLPLTVHLVFLGVVWI